MELDYLQALMAGTLEQSPAEAYRGIWVVAESRRGRLAAVSKEILGCARQLADMAGVHLATVLMGANVASQADEAIAHGSDTVYFAESGLLDVYRSETFTPLLASLILDKRPEIVLFGATTCGRDLAPRLATRLQAGLITECVDLELEESERLLQGTRGVYGGIYLQTTACPKARPQIATVRPGCLPALPPDRTREGTVEHVAVSVSDADIVSMVEPAEAERRPLPLWDARVVVAGGRGMGGTDGFAALEELASVLGGTVAASRSAVEFGWAPRDSMVDIAGSQVHPDLYIAVGISGAFPHRIATRGARCLVAINKDPGAPIFRRADYGIVADWREAIPALTTSLREARAR